MRDSFFVVLPILATLCNALFTVILHVAHTSHAQQPVPNHGLAGRCVEVTGEACGTDLNQFLDDSIPAQNLVLDDKVEDEEDPQLLLMQEYNFKAYVRADISSFYNEKPGSRMEHKPEYAGQAGKFINMSPDAVSLYWDGPNGPVLNEEYVRPWASAGTACHPSHKFIFTKPNKPDQVLCRMTVVPGVSSYYCDPYADENSHKETDPRARGEQLVGGGRSLNSLWAKDKAQYDAHTLNLKFAAAYKNFTGGSEWLSMYPKNPPRHKMWRADYFGQEHTVATKETQFVALPPADQLQPLRKGEMRRTVDALLPYAEYRAPGEMNITIKALSCAPRIFEMKKFLSDAEVDHIIDIVNKQSLDRSTTNGHESETRTSSTTWIPRESDPVLDTVFRRAADVLRMDEALLRDRASDERPDVPTRRSINEQLQIVHYGKSQEYTAHHDFSYPTGLPDSPSRSINLCMYLNDTPQGGHTSFPRWRNGETGGPINVKPEKGKALIFYMVNPDGNLDDLSQHAALPVVEGEKYFANLWIHVSLDCCQLLC